VEAGGVNFRPELAEAVIDGHKWVTRRAVSDNPRSPYYPDRAPTMVRRRIAICPGRGKDRLGTALVVAVAREEFAPMQVTYAMASAEGFTSPSAFWGAWADLHRSLEPVDVWRIELAAPSRAYRERAA
jgi:acyl-CoA synthetase (AMP-forming)/AMP-acid ligase II